MSTRTSPTPVGSFPTTLPPSADASATCCPKMVGTPKWFGAPGLQHSNIVQRRVRELGGYAVDQIIPAPATFGFDDRTNMPAPADRGKNEYWNRGGAPGVSGGPRDLDGSSWLGVAVGSKADIEVRFVGQSGTPCIANVTVVVDDPSKATVTPTTFGSASAKLSITGVAPGEVSVTLMCNGAPIGWCHAAIMTPKTVTVHVHRVNLKDMTGADMTPGTPLSPADIASMKAELDRIYAQCAVTWKVINGSVISYTSPASMTVFNASLAANRTGPSLAEQATLIGEFTAQKVLAGIPLATGTDLTLYYFEAPATYAGFGGFAHGVPGKETVIFATPRSNWDTRLLAHELGHCIGMFHPDETGRVEPQMPDNYRLPIAVGANGATVNICVADHINVMGYGYDAPPMASLRFDQWKFVQNSL